ncbi:MAG: CBS domain-containing protein [Caldilinea sp.]|uniref:CBS domain-containing protein n=1 Tax=Caldilinea sp. TaxID=2293560 RepID=UPI002B582106|nr:CBS domain-containing protein [Anaerolineales bacterium]HQY93230.1 CBS domain-containing protein [Caldilinea sp.]
MNKRHLTEVQDWMRENPVTIAPDATLAAAQELMSEHEVRRLPVVERGELIGIITNSDILRQIPVTADEADDATRVLLTQHIVREVMTYSPMTINPSATIQEAAERMLEYQVSGLPVVRNGKVVGIITESDIFRLVVESWAEE